MAHCNASPSRGALRDRDSRVPATAHGRYRLSTASGVLGRSGADLGVTAVPKVLGPSPTAISIAIPSPSTQTTQQPEISSGPPPSRVNAGPSPITEPAGRRVNRSLQEKEAGAARSFLHPRQPWFNHVGRFRATRGTEGHRRSCQGART